LYNHQDGGAILLDTELKSGARDRKVYNIGWDSVPDHIEEEIVFDSFLAYVQDQMRLQQGFIREEDIDYDPDDDAFD
jgi:hypothetical protein